MKSIQLAAIAILGIGFSACQHNSQNVPGGVQQGEDKTMSKASGDWMRTDERALRSWIESENHQTETELQKSADYESLQKKLEDLNLQVATVSDITISGDSIFFLAAKPGEALNSLYRVSKTKQQGPVKVLDSARFKHGYKLHYFFPTKSLNTLVYGFSPGEDEVADMHVMDLKTGSVEDLPINQLVYPNIAFLPDEKSFVYQRHDNRFHADAGVRYKNVRMRLHRFGTHPDQDPVVADVNEPALPKFAESDRFRAIKFLEKSNLAVMTIRNGTSSPLRIYSKSLDQLPNIKVPWRQKFGEEAKIRWTDADSRYFYILYENAQGQSAIDRIDFADEGPVRQNIFATKEGSIATFRASRDGLYLLKRNDLTTSLLKVSNGRQPVEIKAKDGEVFDGLSNATEQDGVMVRIVSFTHPETFQFWSGARTLFGLDIPGWNKEKQEASDIVVDVEYAEAKDKTRIPIWLVRNKNAPLNTSTPIMIDAYGSYADITKPEYNVNRNEIYKRGGAIAYCMVRGGGELGPAWHEAGRRANKINTVQDTVACAKHLIQKGWTSRDKLALFNSSAGGLIASYVVSHEPDLFRAVITQAAILNVSDLTRMPIGFVNKSEFGDPAIKEENEVLDKLDGFKTLQKPGNYPALLALHGFNDPRVPVWFSTRYVHRLRQLQQASRPALFYGDFETGHGLFATAKQRSERWARIITFLDRQLGFPNTLQ